MKTSESIVKITEALSTFHQQPLTLVKNKAVKGKSYTFHYADLDSVMTLVRKPLADVGVVIINSMTIDDKGEPYEVTRIVHKSGEWMENAFPIGKNMLTQGPQALGGQKTYGRRYNIVDLLSLAADEDTDGDLDNERLPVKTEPKQREADPEADDMRSLFATIRDAIKTYREGGDLAALKQMWIDMSHDIDKVRGYNQTAADQLQDKYDEAISVLAKKKDK